MKIVVRIGTWNIRMDLREIVLEDVDCMHISQDRDRWWALAKTVMKLRVP
jgi:hypothetical protein